MNAAPRSTTVATLACCAALLSGLIAGCQPVENPPPPARQGESTHQSQLQQAWREGRSDLQVEGEGQVIRILADDLEGSRHQRFILEVASGQTLLVAHNIDLAPRIDNLAVGDRVTFFGEYEWNDSGGVIHWTHHDPQNRHPHGWLRHDGRIYR